MSACLLWSRRRTLTTWCVGRAARPSTTGWPVTKRPPLRCRTRSEVTHPATDFHMASSDRPRHGVLVRVQGSGGEDGDVQKNRGGVSKDHQPRRGDVARECQPAGEGGLVYCGYTFSDRMCWLDDEVSGGPREHSFRGKFSQNREKSFEKQEGSIPYEKQGARRCSNDIGGQRIGREDRKCTI